MKNSNELFIEIGTELSKKGVQISSLFGKPCLKMNGKAFACFFQDEMVFKLSGEIHAKAVGLKGAQLFDPSGKKRPMKEWVQVPYAFAQMWRDFASSALEYVTK